MKKAFVFATLVVVLLLSSALPVSADSDNSSIGVNIVRNTEITDEVFAVLGGFGKVTDQIPEINSLSMKVKVGDLAEIQGLSFVEAANPDVVRTYAPIDTVAAEEYAISFGGGGGVNGTVSSQPIKWEHDQDSHGTHVTSTILGYNLRGTPVNGVAPLATVIPVKVLNQNGSGWSSVIAHGITYVADLKLGPLADYPVVINVSLGGSALDAFEKAAIDYAIEAGVIIVASAGNNGEAGMGYPGAYAPVISAGASGWLGEWQSGSWWYSIDDPEPNNMGFYYIVDFSARELDGQDLDVVAPGSLTVYNPDGSTTTYTWGADATGSGLATADGAPAGTP